MKALWEGYYAHLWQKYDKQNPWEVPKSHISDPGGSPTLNASMTMKWAIQRVWLSKDTICFLSLSSTSLVLSQTFTRQNTHYWSPDELICVLSSIGNLYLSKETGRRNMRLQKVKETRLQCNWSVENRKSRNWSLTSLLPWELLGKDGCIFFHSLCYLHHPCPLHEKNYEQFKCFT